MAYLTRLRVEGYRAISDPVVLSDLGPYVAVYGDNAVGKSSILQAADLLGRLCLQTMEALKGAGAPWASGVFFDRFNQDPWMFNARGDAFVAVAGTWSNGLSAEYTVQRLNAGISVRIESLVAEGVDLLDRYRRTREAAEDSERKARSRGALAQEDTHTLQLFATRTRELEQLLAGAGSIAMLAPPMVPVPDETRNAFVAAWNSTTFERRRRARSVASTFASLFPALGAGVLEPVENPPKHPKDVAWVAESGSLVPLDRLGGGIQSAFATLAQLATNDATVACVDEPEAYVGQRALTALSMVLREGTKNGLCEQVWLATHAVSLAGPGDQLFVLESTDGVVKARTAVVSDLARLAPAVDRPKPLSLGRLSDDGSVRLPASLIERLGLRAGDFVHYVDVDESGARIVSPEEFARHLGEDEA